VTSSDLRNAKKSPLTHCGIIGMKKNIRYAELRGKTRSRWLEASERDRQRVLTLPFIEKIVGYNIYFIRPYNEQVIRKRLHRVLFEQLRVVELIYHWEAEPTTNRLAHALKSPVIFSGLDFGSDVAEQDDHLESYFLSTQAYRRCRSKEKCLVIGPKGSGKTAILRTLQREASGAAVVITPEVFATSVLRKFIDDSRDVWDESEAFVSTWIFSILVEVFKRVCQEPKGKAKSLQRIRGFLREHSEYHEADMFTRFILRLKRIEAVKIGKYELGIKTKKLQELYSLEKLYSLVPDLRRAIHDDVLVLIDELDQGWDNTSHSNKFISALMQAALKVQNLGLRVQVIAFLRSEIFDLIKYDLDQLDKLRSGIEELRWETSQLAALLVRRLAFSCKFPPSEVDLGIVNQFIDAPVRGFSGFDYIVSRTAHRPREILQFIKEVHQICIDSGVRRIDTESILRAEAQFSRWKIEHICSEYKYIFPGLSELLWQFRGRGPMLGSDDIEDIVKEFQRQVESKDLEWTKASSFDIMQILYNIEFMGTERPKENRGVPGVLSGYEYCYERPATSIRRSTTFLLHPAFWETLELEPA
jgi:energy-coupling factor transporter ATP-binding protein EcfA2